MFIEHYLPKIFRFWRGVTYRMPRKEKVVYFTFDDGPIPEITPWVLDVLDEYGIKATFFCVGENVARYPEMYREILNRGHKTGNHTYNHLQGLYSGTMEYLDNVSKAAEWIDSDLFRPPHGILRYRQRRRLRKKYRIIQWDVLTRDYNGSLSPEKVMSFVRKYVRNGSIITFHDSLRAEKNMKAVLPQAIAFCRDNGYMFGIL